MSSTSHLKINYIFKSFILYFAWSMLSSQPCFVLFELYYTFQYNFVKKTNCKWWTRNGYFIPRTVHLLVLQSSQRCGGVPLYKCYFYGKTFSFSHPFDNAIVFTCRANMCIWRSFFSIEFKSKIQQSSWWIVQT